MPDIEVCLITVSNFYSENPISSLETVHVWYVFTVNQTDSKSFESWWPRSIVLTMSTNTYFMIAKFMYVQSNHTE